MFNVLFVVHSRSVGPPEQASSERRCSEKQDRHGQHDAADRQQCRDTRFRKAIDRPIDVRTVRLPFRGFFKSSLGAQGRALLRVSGFGPSRAYRESERSWHCGDDRDRNNQREAFEPMRGKKADERSADNPVAERRHPRFAITQHGVTYLVQAADGPVARAVRGMPSPFSSHSVFGHLQLYETFILCGRDSFGFPRGPPPTADRRRRLQTA